MKKYVYVLMIVLLAGLFFALSVLNQLEAPYIEYASFPKCSNDVVITDDLRSSIINSASQKVIQGTGESYFNNHFIFKNLDYSQSTCIFVVRYEFTYDELHTEMSVTYKASGQDTFELTETNTFLRPVGLLVSSAEARQIAANQNISYDYYNTVIDVNKQTFLYKFYKETLAEGNVLVLEIDAQSREIIPVKTVKEFIPIV